MGWQPFPTAHQDGHSRDTWDDDCIEVASALMMGARFEVHPRTHNEAGMWTCIDDRPESDCSAKTGNWNFKRNAARAYLSCHGLYVSKDGTLIHPGFPRNYER